jgi:hypothetical protein
MRLVQEANINAVLTEELLCTPYAVQYANRKALNPFVLGRSVILSYEQDDGFEESSRPSFPCWKGGGRGVSTLRKPW